MTIVISLLIIGSINNFAIAQDTESAVYHWEADASAGLNSDGWEWHVGATYFPIPYIGIGATIGLDGEIQAMSDWGRRDNDWGDNYDSDYCIRFLFKPQMTLRTPMLYFRKYDFGIGMYAQPGATLAPPASGAHNADWAYWHCGGGFYAEVERVVITLGYAYSSFNLGDGHPYTHNWAASNGGTHSVTVGVGYKF